MSILVLGACGLVGSALVRAGAGRAGAGRARGGRAEVRGLSRAQLDITDTDAVARALDAGPSAVINAAAQARVDLAEAEPAWTEAVNHTAVAELARACRSRAIRLVHIGTDYSLSSDADLTPDMAPAPQSTYAASKVRGEQAAVAEGAVVVRIQWVYHPGQAGFFTRTVEALARGEQVQLVSDQIGVPTPADQVAQGLLTAAAGEPVGIFHLACQGHTTPWGWLQAAARALSLPFSARAITRAALGGAARPSRSVLDSSSFAAAFGLRLPAWDEALRQSLAETGWRPDPSMSLTDGPTKP